MVTKTALGYKVYFDKGTQFLWDDEFIDFVRECFEKLKKKDKQKIIEGK